MEVFDVVIVGAGLMGSAAAFYAARAGKRVLLLEQFELLHARGSSHGNSRIFRVAYPNAVYTKLCIESLALWREIEAQSGARLIEMTGELDFATERNADLVALEATLTQHGIAFETLTGAEANARFPGFSLAATSHAVFNTQAGVLNPSLAVVTLQSLAQQRGVEVREHSKVTGIFAADAPSQTVGHDSDHGSDSGGGINNVEGSDSSSDLVVVQLEDGTAISARQCIVTSGAWTTSVLQHAPASLQIQPIATYGTYWKCFDAELYRPGKFPVFINYADPWVYGLPMMDGSDGVKICRHDGPAVDPDARTGVEQPADHAETLGAYVAKNFAHVDASAPTQTDHCMYSMTADENFIIGFWPVSTASGAASSKRVVVGAGFSGHGAKMTPVIGKMLAELALDDATGYDIGLFRASRSAVAGGVTK